MQYSKCSKCIHNNTACRVKMVRFMSLLYDLEYYFNHVPPPNNSSPYKCQIKLDYECTAFKPKNEREENDKNEE